MSQLARALLLSLVLLALFAGLAAASQWWWRGQAVVLRTEQATATRTLLAQVLALAPRDPAAWDESYALQLGELLGGTVTLSREPPGGSVEPSARDWHEVILAHPASENWWLRARVRSSALARLQVTQQRVFAVIIAGGLIVVAMPFGLLALTTRSAALSAAAPQQQQRRADAFSVEQIARLTAERGAALTAAHSARERAEEDLAASRALLARSLEKRIQLGRELHDNVSQTLYAVCLTLESSRKKLTAPPLALARFDHCVGELRRLNQQVRLYLRELEPLAAQQESLVTGLAQMLATLDGAGEGRLVKKIDAAALGLIPPESSLEIINLVREAVSNAVRHGQASQITVHAAHDAGCVILAITDNGVGFEPMTLSNEGHGLANMQARAAALGAQLQIESTPDNGTRVILTLPVASQV